MKQAIIAVEDRRYFEHRGVDMRAIGRALWADIRQAGRRPGRLDDHAAVHQELLLRRQPLDRAQGARGDPGLGPRAALVEEEDPHRVPEHRLLRERGLRRRPGRTDVLRPPREEDDALGGRAARGNPGRPEPVRPGREPPGREAAPPDRPPHHARARDDRRRAVPARRPRAAAEEDHAAGHPRARRLLRELRHPAARRPLQDPRRLRRRARRPHDARPRAPEARPPRDRPLAQGRERPGRRARRDRPEGRRGQGDDRRLELPGEPVQPRRPGRAPGRLVVQAVRPGRRARAGDLPRDDVRLQADDDLPRRQVLAGLELRGRVPRLGEPEDGDDPLGQLGLRAAHGARRAEERPPRGAAARDLEPPERLFLDRPRYRGGQSARDGACVLDVRQPWPPRRRLDLRQQAACDLVGAPGRREAPSERSRAEARAQPGEGRSHQRHPPGGRPAGHGDEGSAPRPAGGRQDRHDGELRRRVVRGLHAAARGGRLGRLPEQPHADADRVRRRRGRGRDVSGADLEVVHGQRAEAPGGGARVLRPAEPPVLGSAQRRPPRWPGHGRQRPLPRPEERLVLLGRDARARGGVQAERGRGPAGRRQHARRREGSAGGPAAPVRPDLPAGQAGRTARRRARADAEARNALRATTT